MRPYILLLFVLVLTSLAGCKKNELPEPVQEIPAVWMDCKINGVKFEFKAGINAVYGSVFNNIIDTAKGQFIFQLVSPEYHKVIEVAINNFNEVNTTVAEDLAKTIQTKTYRYMYSNTFPLLTYKPGEVQVYYGDKATGYDYYSAAYHQDSTRYFSITSVKDVVYHNKHYKLAEVSFSCMVKTPYNNKWYNITEGHGAIPFGEN